MRALEILDNGTLRIVVDPMVGGAITSVVHLASGLEVLGRVPWTTVREPIRSGAAIDEPEFLTRYTGGWPVLFPNAGDACTVDGVFHGFHGEAAVSSWHAERQGVAIRLSRRFTTVPVEMTRSIALDHDCVVVQEELTMLGTSPVDVMWGHHPTFGSDLLAGPFEITSGATTVIVDDEYDGPTNPLVPAARGPLHAVPGKAGPYDLSRPDAPTAALAYLTDFGSAWAAIHRRDNAIAARLTWDARTFPCAWLWLELEGTEAPPWNGRTRLIGIEPNTTWPGRGIAIAHAKGGTLLRLAPGAPHQTALALQVFKP